MGQIKRALRWLTSASLLSSAALLGLFFASGWTPIDVEYERTDGGFSVIYVYGGVIGYEPYVPVSLTPPPFSFDVHFGGGGWESLRVGLSNECPPVFREFTETYYPLAQPAILLLLIAIVLRLIPPRFEPPRKVAKRTGTSPTRTVLKWSATAVAGGLAFVFVLSGWRSVHFHLSTPGDGVTFATIIGVEHGACDLRCGWRNPNQCPWPGAGAGIGSARTALPSFHDLFRCERTDFNGTPGVRFPLLLPLGATLGIAVFLWRIDRVQLPGCCRKCGYDLTSNTSGRCPECGMAIPSYATPDIVA